MMLLKIFNLWVLPADEPFPLFQKFMPLLQYTGAMQPVLPGVNKAGTSNKMLQSHPSPTCVTQTFSKVHTAYCTLAPLHSIGLHRVL